MREGNSIWRPPDVRQPIAKTGRRARDSVVESMGDRSDSDRMKRAILLCTMFFVGGLSGATCISAILPPRDIFREKILGDHEATPDILFIGSSFTDINVDEDVFHRATIKLGHPLSARNLGLYGAREWENDYLIDQIEDHISEAKYVVMDLRAWGNSSSMGGLRSSRAAQWHDIERLLEVLSDISRDPPPDVWRVVADHIIATGLHYIPVGRAWPQPLSNREAHRARNATAPNEEKFSFAGLTYERWIKFNEHMKSTNKYEPREVARTSERIERIRSLGTEVIIIFPPAPTARNHEVLKALRAAGIQVEIIDFDDPREYPELYDKLNRYDYAHLNWRGIKIYSRLLAQKIVEIELRSYPG